VGALCICTVVVDEPGTLSCCGAQADLVLDDPCIRTSPSGCIPGALDWTLGAPGVVDDWTDGAGLVTACLVPPRLLELSFVFFKSDVDSLSDFFFFLKKPPLFPLAALDGRTRFPPSPVLDLTHPMLEEKSRDM